MEAICFVCLRSAQCGDGEAEHRDGVQHPSGCKASEPLGFVGVCPVWEWGQCCWSGRLHHGGALRERPAHTTALHQPYPQYQVPKSTPSPWAVLARSPRSKQSTNAALPLLGLPPHTPPAATCPPLPTGWPPALSPPLGSLCCCSGGDGSSVSPWWPRQTPPASPTTLLSDGEQPPADQQQDLGPGFGKPGTAPGEVWYIKRHSHSALERQNILFFPISALYRKKAVDMYAHKLLCDQ